MLTGEVIDLLDMNEINEKLRNEKKKPALFERVFLGITKASFKLIHLYQQHHFKKLQEF